MISEQLCQQLLQSFEGTERLELEQQNSAARKEKQLQLKSNLPLGTFASSFPVLTWLAAKEALFRGPDKIGLGPPITFGAF